MPADGTLAAITPAEISASSPRQRQLAKDCTRPQQKQVYRDGRPYPRKNGFGTSRRKRSVEISAGQFVDNSRLGYGAAVLQRASNFRRNMKFSRVLVRDHRGRLPAVAGPNCRLGAVEID
jgi:hypothetical protein